jgi:hypothetical protein
MKKILPLPTQGSQVEGMTLLLSTKNEMQNHAGDTDAARKLLLLALKNIAERHQELRQRRPAAHVGDTPTGSGRIVKHVSLCIVNHVSLCIVNHVSL